MVKTKQLFRNTILYAVANFGTATLNFLLLPFYTRYFSPEEFGTWDLTITTITLLLPIITLELTSATYRWLIDEGDVKQQKVIISTGFFQILQQIIGVNILTLLIYSFISFSYQWEGLVLLNTTIIANFLLQCTRALHKNFLFACLSLLQGLMIVFTNLIMLLIFSLGIEAFYYANIFSNIFTVTSLWFFTPFKDLISIRYISKNTNITPLILTWINKFFPIKLESKKVPNKLLLEYFAYSLPMIVAAISWWFMTLSDRWIIGLFLGIKENGIYAISTKVPAVLLMINTVFSMAWKDEVILNFTSKEKNEYFSLVFKYYFRFLSLAVLFLTFVSKPVIYIFIGEAFSEAWKYSGLLLIGALFHSLSLFWSAGFHGAKKTKAILHSTVVGAITNITLSIVLIKHLGLYAVSLSTLVAFFITWIIRVKESKEYFKIKVKKFEVILFLIVIISYNIFILIP